jgi:hypothetical protein
MKLLFVKEGGYIMNKKFFCSLLVAGLIVSEILIVGCKGEEKGPAKVEGPQKVEEVRPLKNAINIRAKGEILHYQRESLWSKEGFSGILKSKGKFESDQIESFKKNLERYGVINPKIKLNEARKSTTLICDVKGAMYDTNSCEFHWLLGDLPFDLYQFKQSEKELYYEGEINGVPTTIRLIFPYTIAHCHEHVWPR